MDEFRTGYGTAWLDFLATRIGRYRNSQVDQLGTPEALRAWLSAHDLAPTEPVDAGALQTALELREALHLAAVAALGEAPLAPAALRTIETTLAADQPLRVKRGATGLRTSRPRTAPEALARLARFAVHDLSGPNRALLRACGDDTCAGIFLDHTGRRQWCADERCGNRARVRAHRARTQKARPRTKSE